MKRPLFVTTVALAIGLTLASCGDDGSPASSATTAVDAEPAGSSAPFPVTVGTPSGDVTIEDRPGRIVSLSSTATEMLFAIEAGDQVVAVDSESNFPDDAPTTELSGFEPNLEAIASYEPDLVVAAGDPGDLVDGLSRLGIPTIVQPAAQTLDDTYAQIDQLGHATGNPDEADALVETMEADIAELVEQVPEREAPITYFHELDDMLYTVTSETYIGQLYGMAGFKSIADAVDDGTAGGYPQLSAETVIDADPDFVFLADTKCCSQDIGTVSARPGWDQLTAVNEGRVVELDDDISSRWGPRVVDFLRTLVEQSIEAGA